jgi:hypothetical protein
MRKVVLFGTNRGGGSPPADDRFIFTVKTDNAGTSADTQFTIPTSTTGITEAFLYDIETSDGQTITGVTGNHTITFPTAGTYEVRISGSFPYMYFNSGGDKLKLLEIKNFGVYALGSTSQQSAFYDCSNLVITATDSGYFENVTNFLYSWVLCNSITSFPLIDTSSGTNFYWCWRGCTSLTSFPANAFDTNIATNYTSAFTSTNLTTQSIDNILVSLDTNGVSNGTFAQSGGQAPSATGEAAIDSLVGKGWTITVTGGYTPPQLLLDEYPNAAAAYSLRALSTASVGSAVVRVRRSSDNAEQDFTATEITDGTLTTFTGDNDGFVTTWYDQSGNGVDGVQATANVQPRIVSNGVLESDNGKPTINFAVDKRLATLSDNIISQPTTYFTLGKLNNAGTSAFFDGRFADTNRQLYGDLFGITEIGLSAGTQLEIMPYTTETIISTTIFNSTNSKCYINGIERGVVDAGTQSINWGTLGNYFNGAGGNLSTQEVILYPTNQDANRIPIETNINNHYLAYGDVINGGFLNTYQGFNGAYSLRKLAEYDNGYDVEVVNVRRSSDNLNRDFTATEITDGTLESFVGIGNDGFVQSWYDQSLNQNHLYQLSTYIQPKIVENGVLISENGKPAIDFDGTTFLKVLNSNTTKAIFVVCKDINLNANAAEYVIGSDQNDNGVRTSGTAISGIGVRTGTVSINSTIKDTNQHLITIDINAQTVRVDGSVEASGVMEEFTYNTVGMRINPTVLQFTGLVQEVISSNINQTTNISAIETNINTEYTIY